MGPSASPRRRILWILCACALLLPRLAAAGEQPLLVDFDGDGQHDRITVGAANEASQLRVWLSASQDEQQIRTRSTVLQFVVSDLDGDHRPELITRDSKQHIHVWTRKGRKFHSYRPRPSPVGALLPSHRSVEDSDDERPGADTSPRVVPFALLLSPSPRSPDAAGAGASALDSPRFTRAIAPVDPFAPRPPPAVALS